MIDYQYAAGRGAPLPTTLEDALTEIQVLRRILVKERQLLVQKVQEIQDLKMEVVALKPLEDL